MAAASIRDPMASSWDATSIVSPTTRKRLGACRHDVAALEGGLSKSVLDPGLLKSVRLRPDFTATPRRFRAFYRRHTFSVLFTLGFTAWIGVPPPRTPRKRTS